MLLTKRYEKNELNEKKISKINKVFSKLIVFNIYNNKK